MPVNDKSGPTTTTPNGMYNFVTHQFDDLFDEVPSDLSCYIPQYPEALLLYEVYTKEGHRPLDAVKRLLRVYINLEAAKEDNNVS